MEIVAPSVEPGVKIKSGRGAAACRQTLLNTATGDVCLHPVAQGCHFAIQGCHEDEVVEESP
jgi:hypothetical protein